MTLQTLATEARAGFILGERDEKGLPTVWVGKHDRDEWVTDMVFAAHDGSLPDDWTYSFVVECLDAIGEMVDADDCDEVHEACDGMVDIYNHRLRAWFASGREDRVDQAVEEFGPSEGGIIQALMWGQYAEIRDVFAVVLSHLSDELSNREEAASE